MPIRLDARDADFEREFSALLAMKREVSEDVDQVAAAIIADIRARGDAALIDYTERFDKLSLSPQTLRVTESEIEAAFAAAQASDDPDVEVLLQDADLKVESVWRPRSRREKT